MKLDQLTPDEEILWEWGFAHVNATLLFTWMVMLIMVLASWLITRHLSHETRISRWQNLLEVCVSYIRQEIYEIGHHRNPNIYLPFVGTLFLFIAVSSLFSIVPGYVAPTASLSTTTALALCVFVAVPIFGIIDEGIGTYLRRYIEPNPMMLPFNIMGELSRTLSLAVRLFGNVMSGAKIVAVMVSIAPLFIPIVLSVLGLITGMIQAYIFAVLAMVYMASGEATRSSGSVDPDPSSEDLLNQSRAA